MGPNKEGETFLPPGTGEDQRPDPAQAPRAAAASEGAGEGWSLAKSLERAAKAALQSPVKAHGLHKAAHARNAVCILIVLRWAARACVHAPTPPDVGARDRERAAG